MKIIMIVSTAALLCASCASNRNAPSTGQTVYTPSPSEIAMDKCESIISRGFIRRNAVAYESCVVRAKSEYHLYKDDLDELDDRKRLELAKQWAAGKIDADQFNLKAQESKVAANSTRLVRSTQESYAESASRTAAAAEEGAAAAQRAANKSYICNTNGSRNSSTTYCY